MVYDRSGNEQRFEVPWTAEDVPTLAFITTASFLIYALSGGIKLH